ncbi:hypothetical protein ASPCAL10186 [Aspergillus calidoustus]|uniref:F-box domain-containing protein n=1 Tax=Aspergillus calidoustus TaxID=454130 RepID=A0A0U5CBW5_ASPCI|nr:hypothetical protein ASPCAL10186 [Aspergillus calidoustus]
MPSLKRKFDKGQEYVRYITKRIKLHRRNKGRGAGRFDTLPPEVIHIIATFTERRALSRLRATCCYIFNSTQYHWQHTYSVQTIRTDFSKRSLKRLEKLCKHRELMLKVETLLIQEPRRTEFGKGFTWKRDSGAFPEMLRYDQDAVKQWQAVFSKLVNCRSFIFHAASEAHRPTNKLTGTDALVVLLYILAGSGIPAEIPREVSGVDPKRLSAFEMVKLPGFKQACASIRSLCVSGAMRGEESIFATMLPHTAALQKLIVRNCWDQEAEPFMAALAHLARDEPLRFHLREFEYSRSVFDRRQRAPVNATRHFTQFLASQNGSLRKLVLGPLSVFEGSFVPVLDSLRDNNKALEDITIRDMQCWPSRTRLRFPGIEKNPVVRSFVQGFTC